MIGFILRLAYRNGTASAQVAARMGLLDEGSGSAVIVSPWLLADMDKPRLVRVARAAQLTVAEAGTLLLAPLGQRYGLLSRRYGEGKDPRQLARPNRWVFMRTSPYCPQCLAGCDAPSAPSGPGPKPARTQAHRSWPPCSTPSMLPAPRRPSPCSTPPGRRRPPSPTPRRRPTLWPRARFCRPRRGCSELRIPAKRESR
nr:TniQ family protein [Streptomyces scabichelini]